MSKAGKKLLDAAKEAVKVARCDHSSAILIGTRETPSIRTWTYACNDCGAVIHKPQKMWGIPTSETSRNDTPA